MNEITKTEGILVESVKHTESQIISHVYTQSNGMLSFIARISNSKKSTKRKNAFQPLHLISLEFLFKENASIQKLKDWNLNYPYHTIPFDDKKRTITFFLSELLNKVLHSENQNELLYDFLKNSFQYFDLQEKNYANFHLWFLVQLAKHVGFGPTLKKGFYFDFVEGDFTNTKPHHSRYIEKHNIDVFSNFLSVGLPNYHLVNMNQKSRNEFLFKLLDFYSVRFPEILKLKSFEIIQELYR